MNTTDITDLSDAALDALLSIKSGDENVDAGALTVADRYALAAALGWEMNSRTRYWAEAAPAHVTRSAYAVRFDAEAAILAAQEDDGNNV